MPAVKVDDGPPPALAEHQQTPPSHRADASSQVPSVEVINEPPSSFVKIWDTMKSSRDGAHLGDSMKSLEPQTPQTNITDSSLPEMMPVVEDGDEPPPAFVETGSCDLGELQLEKGRCEDLLDNADSASPKQAYCDSLSLSSAMLNYYADDSPHCSLCR